VRHGRSIFGSSRFAWRAQMVKLCRSAARFAL
jgi:hypothetical protein